MSPEPFVLREGSLWILPVRHYRMELADEVRRAIRDLRPAQVALELAEPLGKAFLEAVERLPYLSIVAYKARSSLAVVEAAERLTKGVSSGGAEEDAFMILPVEPTDPFAEAARTARELEIPVQFVDLAVGRYPEVYDPLPDTYAVFQLGLQQYWEEYARYPSFRTDADLDRELHMAWRLKELASQGPVLLVCGMAHVRGVLEAFRGGHGRPGTPAEIFDVEVLDPELESLRGFSEEIPFLMAAYEFQRGGPGPDPTWEDPPEPEQEPEPEAPANPLDAMSGQDAVLALESLLGISRPGQAPQEELEITPELLKAVHRYLRSIPEKLLPPGFAPELELQLEGAPVQPRRRMRVFKFKSCQERRSRLREVYSEVGESCSRDSRLDRQRLLVRLCEEAGAFYEDNTGDQLKRWQLRTLAQFARNYCRLKGRLLPDTYELVMAARGVADDNYSYEVWDLGTFYPWTDSAGTHRPIELGEELILDGRAIKRWTFHRRLPSLRHRLVPVPVKRRAREDKPGEWEEEFRRGTICSYPPEDVVIEDYGRYLQKKGIQVLSEERARVEPFTTSLMDGIDMRETIRNWHADREIYVREVRRVQGGAGSVVLIFDEDRRDDRYPWKMTWHGEHSQESDMAFFATPPTAKVVGPGIARCEYGGLMLTHPPRRLLDVWSDPLFYHAQTKAEVLLLAAIDYSVEKHIVYVASQPPRSVFRSVAGRLGKKVVYIPIGQLSPVSLKKIRVFHVLGGHHLRQIAKDYIW